MGPVNTKNWISATELDKLLTTLDGLLKSGIEQSKAGEHLIKVVSQLVEVNSGNQELLRHMNDVWTVAQSTQAQYAAAVMRAIGLTDEERQDARAWRNVELESQVDVLVDLLGETRQIITLLAEMVQRHHIPPHQVGCGICAEYDVELRVSQFLDRVNRREATARQRAADRVRRDKATVEKPEVHTAEFV